MTPATRYFRPVRMGRVTSEAACFAALVALLVGLASPARSEDAWAPVLEPLSSGAFQRPRDSYQLQIPPEQRQGLALELDGIDISSQLRWEGEYARFTPPQPLAFGKHGFRLLRYVAGGTVVELGRWAIEVRHSRHLREVSAAADITVTGYQRLAKNLDGSAANGTGVQGGANLQTRVANGKWSIDGNANVLLDSSRQSTADQGWIDIGEYLLSGTARDDQASASVYLGHHDEAFSGLILQSFNHRGISGSVSTRVLHTELSAFSKRTDAITGSKDFFCLYRSLRL